MTKTKFILLFIVFFLTIEIFSHFYFPIFINVFFKACLSILLFLFYYFQIDGKLIQADKLFFFTIFFGFLGEIFFVFQQNEINNSFLLFLYLVEHQLYISLLRPKRFITYMDSNYDFIKKGWPYLLIAFLFFGFFLMDIIPDSIFLLSIFYVFQFSILGAYSLMLSKNKLGKNYIVLGVIVVSISDILASYYVFIGKFPSSYIIIRAVYYLSKVLLAYGFLLKRNNKISGEINHWDMGDI
ncbi:hypothetical protein EGI22_07055 [Lacihabitans sp. LS3-19]|uniref:lysoplasmalogenase family protein n=1 Tax=Lacihabitans sp. LS3-19 TaxID=2487335 RepID=UPI0020CF31E2|nr:lysoplasmalogenase family protein [Lacihabitans sp. LS3-19]MCP9767666.1 hypothetical protein [Lacihabitans sp. LS3-19]